MRSRALASAAVGVAAFIALAGCGDSKDSSAEAKNFCSVVTPIQGIGSAIENSDDTAAVKSAMSRAESAIAQVASAKPPADIAAQFTVVKERFTAANEALKKTNYNFDTLDPAGQKTINDLDSPDFQKAADEIQTWSSKNCK
jgi:hypothetical protein